LKRGEQAHVAIASEPRRGKGTAGNFRDEKEKKSGSFKSKWKKRKPSLPDVEAQSQSRREPGSGSLPV